MFNPAVYLTQFGVGESRVGLGDGNEGPFVAGCESVIRVKTGAAAVTGLGIDENEVGGVGIDFPFPPVAADPAYFVIRLQTFEHDPLDPALAGLGPCPAQVIPLSEGDDWGQT